MAMRTYAVDFKRLYLGFFALILLSMSMPAPQLASSWVDSKTIDVIVRSEQGMAGAAAAVRRVGGEVATELPIIDGVEGRIAQSNIHLLESDPRVVSVTRDGRVSFQSGDFTMTPERVGTQTRSRELWNQGITGSGVTVAVLDTGVYAGHPDLAGRVLHCEDLSHEAGTEAHCADTFGHGTFMAGLIAGNGASSSGVFKGSAPGANIVSVKLAGYDGSADVSNVLAGIQWAVAHRAQYGIKVMNLSLGSDATTSYLFSPLNYAVQRAWKSGITVVVSAGNSGPDKRTVLKPADDPYVITVGAANDEGTMAVTDDKVPVFSSRGPTRSDGFAKPDLVAPGVHTVSLRSPGSAIDQKYGASAAVGDYYFRGTGTSMAAAVTSGVAAQILQANPSLVPDQVKYRLTATARPIAETDRYAVGAGIVDAYAAARSTTTRKANQNLLLGLSTGLGLLQGDRGSVETTATTPEGSGDTRGEYKAQYNRNFLSLSNILGLVPWSGLTYTTLGWDATSWKATSWKLDSWAATSWKATSWKQTVWEATSWKGTAWENADWVATSWKSINWDATSWKATSWKSTWYAAAWD